MKHTYLKTVVVLMLPLFAGAAQQTVAINTAHFT
jgi:hypothetical protein